MKRKIFEHPSDVVEETAIKTYKTIRKYQWKYRNIFYLLISFLVAYFILTSNPVVAFIQKLGNFGYPAAFVSGMFFTYGLTTAPATAAIYNLGQSINPFMIAFLGAFGAMISDYIIFKFVRKRLLKEIKMLSGEISDLTKKEISFISKGTRRLTKSFSDLFFWEEFRIRIWRTISRSKIWQIIIPIFAGIIIASPLPDELGVAIFGAVRFPTKKFLFFAYIFNFIGIFMIAYSHRVLSFV